MPRNIELKARCADLNAAREHARAAGAVFVGVLVQRDTYFVCPRGRLKLRETEGRPAELIAYARADRPAARGSDYVVTPVAEAPAMIGALGRALGIRGVVAKRRELWTWERVRVHLDDVEGLGTFVEFEAVLADGEPDEAGHARLAALRVALRVAGRDVEAGSYADLMGLGLG